MSSTRVTCNLLGRFCTGMRTTKRLCQRKRCTFLFGEVLRCLHFGHKNDKRKSGDILARLSYLIVIKNKLGGG